MRGRATFDFRFDAAAEVVGGMKLRIWMAAPDADDLDVFVAAQKLDAYGDLVGFPFYAVFEHGPVALAWHDDLTNRGRHVIYSGGGHDSHLLVPVLTD